MLDKAEGEAKTVLRKLKEAGYRKIVMGMINQNQHADSPDPTSNLSIRAKQTVEDVMSSILSARKALGKVRLATATKAAEFMRVIFGDEKTKVAVGGGYYC